MAVGPLVANHGVIKKPNHRRGYIAVYRCADDLRPRYTSMERHGNVFIGYHLAVEDALYLCWPRRKRERQFILGGLLAEATIMQSIKDDHDVARINDGDPYCCPEHFSR